MSVGPEWCCCDWVEANPFSQVPKTHQHPSFGMTCPTIPRGCNFPVSHILLKDLIKCFEMTNIKAAGAVRVVWMLRTSCQTWKSLQLLHEACDSEIYYNNRSQTRYSDGSVLKKKSVSWKHRIYDLTWLTFLKEDRVLFGMSVRIAITDKILVFIFSQTYCESHLKVILKFVWESFF